MSFRTSELEIDEGLEAGGDELVEEEDRQDADEGHEGQGKHCEAQAVAAFETGREPVDKHSEGHEQKDLPIGGADVRDDREIPLASDLGYHIPGGGPGLLVGLSRVQVGAAAEEEAGEGDEDEGLQYGPGVAQIDGEALTAAHSGQGRTGLTAVCALGEGTGRVRTEDMP